MPRVQVRVRLSGRWSLPEMERELGRGPIEMDLPEDVVAQAFLRSLADLYPRFQRKALKATGELRAEVRVFLDDDQIEDLRLPIGDRLHRGAEVSIVYLAPLSGG